MAEELAPLAPDLLDRLQRTVLKLGRHITRRSDKELHGLRRVPQAWDRFKEVGSFWN